MLLNIPAGSPARKNTVKNMPLLLVLLCLLSACQNDSMPDNAASEPEVFRDTLRDGSAGPEMVVLPPGIFRMGDLSPNQSGAGDRQDSRLVAMRGPIAMSRYEVTFADYDRFVLATSADIPDDRGWGRDNRPVIYVSQKDARAYANWLSAQTGKRYRLPTEVEWEYAAQADTTRYSWIKKIGRNWFSKMDRSQTDSEQGGEQTVPVGSFAANAFGLHDMHGNICEWVENCHSDNADVPLDGSARTACDDTASAVRCGSWAYNPSNLRTVIRHWYLPSNRNFYIGFRLVQDLSP